MKQNKMTISFSNEYQELYKYLKSLPNASRYVCSILQEHMGHDDLDVRIEKVVKKVLAGNEVRATRISTTDSNLRKAVDIFD